MLFLRGDHSVILNLYIWFSNYILIFFTQIFLIIKTTVLDYDYESGIIRWFGISSWIFYSDNILDGDLHDVVYMYS